MVFFEVAYSGLMITQDKTETLLLGNNASNSLDLGTIKIKKAIKILVVHFTYNNLFTSWTFNQPRNFWEIRLNKSFALPKILYRLMMISNKKEFIKKVNTLLYSFIWKGNDSPIEKGGLKMPDLDDCRSKNNLYYEVSCSYHS